MWVRTASGGLARAFAGCGRIGRVGMARKIVEQHTVDEVRRMKSGSNALAVHVTFYNETVSDYTWQDDSF